MLFFGQNSDIFGHFLNFSQNYSNFITIKCDDARTEIALDRPVLQGFPFAFSKIHRNELRLWSLSEICDKCSNEEGQSLCSLKKERIGVQYRSNILQPLPTNSEMWPQYSKIGYFVMTIAVRIPHAKAAPAATHLDGDPKKRKTMNHSNKYTNIWICLYRCVYNSFRTVFIMRICWHLWNIYERNGCARNRFDFKWINCVGQGHKSIPHAVYNILT